MSNETGAGRGWTWFFWIAAIFNFLVGIAVILGPSAPIDTRLVGILVFAFGLVYAVVARDPDRYADVIWAGVFGKVAVVALLVTAEMNQSGGDAPTAILAIDVLFAAGFLIFLLTRSETGGR
ncbi:MAG: hypothetical protein O3C52_07760 [Proteobacteria bacterium]|nr:hypothetical protein [Pseudomonadota bacterium]MDA0914639.1 hypothetical protein [Pseudomonadota bacterium]MDA1033245.1 hypothetical protein [Pseudomonadota bacterium]